MLMMPACLRDFMIVMVIIKCLRMEKAGAITVNPCCTSFLFRPGDDSSHPCNFIGLHPAVQRKGVPRLNLGGDQ